MRDEILRNTQATLQVSLYSAGVLTNADGAVLVTVSGADGSAISSAGTATNGGTGIYTYALAPQTDLDLLSVAWTGAFGAVSQTVTTHAEIMGAHYVSLADVRALDGLSDTSKYPLARLAEVRSWFADKVEGTCGLSFVPRFGRVVLDGDDSTWLLLPHLHVRSLQSVHIDGVAVTPLTDWHPYDSGKIARDDGGTFPAGVGNVIVQYEHGLDVPPESLREAALVAIRYKLLGDNSGIPDWATSLSTEGGTISGPRAGPGRPFGIPEVDAVVAELTERGSLVG